MLWCIKKGIESDGFSCGQRWVTPATIVKQTTSREAKHTQHIEITHPHNVNSCRSMEIRGSPFVQQTTPMDHQTECGNYGSKRHRIHTVELSQRFGKPCANCVDPSRPQQWGPDYRFLSKPAMRTRWMAGNALHKSGQCRD